MTGSYRDIRALAARLIREERGQDLIEYGLLGAIIGITGVLVFSTFAGKMEFAYNGWNAAAQAAWEPCDPISLGGACP